jgi:hypothetical protein
MNIHGKPAKNGPFSPLLSCMLDQHHTTINAQSRTNNATTCNVARTACFAPPLERSVLMRASAPTRGVYPIPARRGSEVPPDLTMTFVMGKRAVRGQRAVPVEVPPRKQCLILSWGHDRGGVENGRGRGGRSLNSPSEFPHRLNPALLVMGSACLSFGVRRAMDDSSFRSQ